MVSSDELVRSPVSRGLFFLLNLPPFGYMIFAIIVHAAQVEMFCEGSMERVIEK